MRLKVEQFSLVCVSVLQSHSDFNSLSDPNSILKFFVFFFQCVMIVYSILVVIL